MSLNYIRKQIDKIFVIFRLGKTESKKVFTDIYKKDLWRGKSSVSGKGSDYEQIKVVIDELPIFLNKYNVRSMLDIPCGDFAWMSKVNLNGVNYIGADIVEDLIAKNNSKYSCENVSFRSLDLTNDSLPKVDLVFVRDCLVHLSYNDINKAIENIKNSGSEYLMTTSFVNRKKNKNIKTGRWRALNLLVSPFNLPGPIYTINEKCTERNGRYIDKTLCVWKISDL